MSSHISNERPQPDKVLVDIADYVLNYEIKNELAWKTAHYCLLDTLGCGLEALTYPACTKLLGPIVPGTVVPNGAKVPGTRTSPRSFGVSEVSPINVGCMEPVGILNGCRKKVRMAMATARATSKTSTFSRIPALG